MTELGHGSNVAALQTECVLDTTTDEWIVNTPDDSAIKWCAMSSFVASSNYWHCIACPCIMEHCREVHCHSSTW